jgi:hypothetical protein
MKRLRVSLLLALTTALPGLALAETGNVALKINVVNPSEKEPQTVPVKIYLPKEATPKNVKDLGGLKLDYEQDTGMYYVYGEVALEPGQSVMKVVQIEDIWVFSEQQLAALVTRAREAAGKLTEPSAAEEAQSIVQRIEQSVEEILKRQQETDGKPGERIQAYRQGLAAVAAIERDIDALHKLKELASDRERKAPVRNADSRQALLAGSGEAPQGGASEGGAPEGGAPRGRPISMTAAWRIILVILAFLGVLSAVFFLTWHRLLRVTVGREQQAIPLVQGDSSG